MLSAYEAFDLVLKNLINITGGSELQDLVYHATHVPDWTQTRESKMARHNQHTAFNWFRQHNLKWP